MPTPTYNPFSNLVGPSTSAQPNPLSVMLHNGIGSLENAIVPGSAGPAQNYDGTYGPKPTVPQSFYTKAAANAAAANSSPSLSSVYSGASSANSPTSVTPTPTGATGATPLFPNPTGTAGSTPAGATGATGSSFPSQYYNPDGSLKSPQQVASDVGNSLVAAHVGNGDVGTLAGQQLANPDGGTTADAAATASSINNTKNDISTGATDPYGVAGSSGIAYTPQELDAIQKAYAGVYTPALNTALAKVTLKQSEDKAALDQQNSLAQIDEQAKATVAAQANQPYILGADQIRYDASGNPIASGPESYQRALLTGSSSQDLTPVTQTTASGNKYVDLTNVTNADQKTAYENAARAQGIPLVTDANVQKLQNIDDTRSNLGQIATQFAKVGYGNGFEKALGGFGASSNIESAFGNSDVGSFNAWRTAAINSIQALAGGSGSGVRINQAEINSAMQNDIPNVSDTIAQGNAKIQVLNKQLDNWENQILHTSGSDGSNASGATGAAAPITTPDGKQWVQNADGTYTSFKPVGNTTASSLPQLPASGDTSLNRPQRNNNPGDIKPGGIADTFAKGRSAEGDLAFATPQDGFNAMAADLTAKINGQTDLLPANPTIGQLGKVWAEDPNWGPKVAGILKVPVNTPTKSIPLPELMHAIAVQEGFYA